MTPIILWRNGAFGDTLLTAQAVAILNDNGIPAYFKDDRSWFRALVDVPLWQPGVEGRELKFYPTGRWDGRGMLRIGLDRLAEEASLGYILTTRQFAPTRYLEDSSIPGTDVVIASACGSWSRYRQYPRMADIKDGLSRRRINWLDLSEKGIQGQDALNWVSKSRVYLGIETGVSHYVAQYVQRGIIIQSGYSNPKFWASAYPYQFIEKPVSCNNCFLRRGCRHAHQCMDIPPDKIVMEIMRCLDQPRKTLPSSCTDAVTISS